MVAFISRANVIKKEDEMSIGHRAPDVSGGHRAKYYKNEERALLNFVFDRLANISLSVFTPAERSRLDRSCIRRGGIYPSFHALCSMPFPYATRDTPCL